MIRDFSNKYTLKNIIIDVIFLVKLLSMRVAVDPVSRVGLRIIGNKEFEYMASRNFSVGR